MPSTLHCSSEQLILSMLKLPFPLPFAQIPYFISKQPYASASPLSSSVSFFADRLGPIIHSYIHETLELYCLGKIVVRSGYIQGKGSKAENTLSNPAMEVVCSAT